MGMTAENVAERYGVSRADQDQMAVESHAKALTQTCRDVGYLVTTVSSGEEALDRVYSQQRGGSNQGVFELVLCDVELPGIPGVEVLNHLRSNLQHSDISIIMLASVRCAPPG